jgi:hypothetical protein
MEIGNGNLAPRDNRVESEKTEHLQVMHNSGNNKRTTVVQEIRHICFPVLTYLNLCLNEIQSVEGLVQGVYAEPSGTPPMCIISDVGNNRINSVGAIRKANCPSLQLLSIRIKSNMQIITTSEMGSA